MKKYYILIGIIAFAFIITSFERKAPKFVFYKNLSEWDFFKGDMKLLQPAKGVVPYEMNTPLFSDFSLKDRFIRLPKGEQAVYNDTAVFEMPEGTILIKNFSFPTDFNHPELGRRIIETRLLIKRAEGWLPYQYIWNNEQTEAEFVPMGGITTVSYTDTDGKQISSKYIIPNQMQCRSCHRQNDQVIRPIGLAARHLNGDYTYQTGKQNQLAYWAAHNMMEVPEGNHPANAVWKDANAALESKARAYLDINCGFCHKPDGVANTTGLFLQASNTNSTSLGINKTPVAAGLRSGGLQHDIESGHPEKSILVYRMNSTDDGIAMPQIGRVHIHKEGVALISDWIKSMKP